jgi:gamma-glutamyl-gamma-aminobutyrate hydrolase PuuD
VNSIHHQAVRKLGNDLRVEARSVGDGIVEAIRWQGAGYLFGCQWHPEFHGDTPDLLGGGPIMAQFLAAAQAGVR